MKDKEKRENVFTEMIDIVREGAAEASRRGKLAGVCPVCGVTIGAAHLMYIKAGFSDEQVHEAHLSYQRGMERVGKALKVNEK